MPPTVTFIKLIYFFIVDYRIIITNHGGVWQALAVMEWISAPCGVCKCLPGLQEGDRGVMMVPSKTNGSIMFCARRKPNNIPGSLPRCACVVVWGVKACTESLARRLYYIWLC